MSSPDSGTTKDDKSVDLQDDSKYAPHDDVIEPSKGVDLSKADSSNKAVEKNETPQGTSCDIDTKECQLREREEAEDGSNVEFVETTIEKKQDNTVF